MVARVNTVAFHGIQVLDADVQVQVAAGLPAITVVGLPDKPVAECRERVRAALYAVGLALPPKRITVNLSPADLAKEGSHFDRPIALGLLALDRPLTTVAGVLPAAIHASAGGRGVICPVAQSGNAA
jgi:magnesium chelatase family protein